MPPKLSAPGENLPKPGGLSNPMSFNTISEPSNIRAESITKPTSSGLFPPSNANNEVDQFAFNTAPVKRIKEDNAFDDDWGKSSTKKVETSNRFSDFSETETKKRESKNDFSSFGFNESTSKKDFGFAEEKPKKDFGFDEEKPKNEVAQQNNDLSSFSNFNSVSTSKFNTFDDFGTTSTTSAFNTQVSTTSSKGDGFGSWSGFGDQQDNIKPSKPASSFTPSFDSFEETKKEKEKKSINDFDSFGGFGSTTQNANQSSKFTNFDNFGKDTEIKSSTSSDQPYNMRYSISMSHSDLSITQQSSNSNDVTFSSPDNDYKQEIYDEDNRNIKESYIESLFNGLSKLKLPDSSITNEIKENWNSLVDAFLKVIFF